LKNDKYDLAIHGRVVFGNYIIEDGVVLINGELIAGLGKGIANFQAKQILGSRKHWVLPGVIDAHVHSYSNPEEGFFNSTRSAAAGGVTTIIDMPMDAPLGISDPKSLEKKISLISSDSFVDVALLGAVKNETLSDIAALKEAGVCGFKLSLFDTDPNRFPRVHDGHLLEAFSRIKDTGLTAGVHAENDEIVKYLIKQHKQAGNCAPEHHIATRPPVTETESVLKGLEIARATDVRFHLYHLSCKRSVELAWHYRQEGLRVTMETCPHYLVLKEQHLKELGAKARINPPVRGEKEAEALWLAIEQDLIDCVSSDHGPWPLEYKMKPSIFENASGAPGVETLLPLMYTKGVVEGKISINSLVRVLSENPARIFGLYPRKGCLLPGSDADVVLLEPDREDRIKAEKLHTLNRWTPYEDFQVNGSVAATVVRGAVVATDGEIVGEKGYGEFIRPV
jgi:allantoinase